MAHLFKKSLPLVAALLIAASVHARANDPSDFSGGKETLSGNYLAGRFAQMHQDWTSAGDFLNRAYQMDPGNTALLQRSFLLALGSGDFDTARKLGAKMVETKENPELAILFLGCDALERKDYKQAKAYVDQLPKDGFGQFSKPLLGAWILAGLGDTKAALELIKPDKKTSDPTYTFHSGLIAEFAGDIAGAKDYYKAAMTAGMSVRNSYLISEFFQKQGDTDYVKELESGLSKLNTPRKIRTDEIGKPTVSRPAEGAALALFELTSALFEHKAYDSALVYGRLTQVLDPKAAYVQMMLGDTLAREGHYDEAVNKYRSVPDSSEFFWLSRLRTAETYEMSGRAAEAVALLSKLSDENVEFRTDALAYLGDIYRKQEQFGEAVKAYSAALSTIKEPTPDYWSLYYARGVALERSNDWVSAEKDLLQALEYRPENPMILNYLGYSWIDKGMRTAEAEKMLKKAVMLKPDDGYILDSYGWALYKNGNATDSINWLERAIERVPDDTTVNDHLGDVLYSLGRKTEAHYQWQRALKFAETDEERGKIEEKVKSGIVVPAKLATSDTVEIKK